MKVETNAALANTKGSMLSGTAEYALRAVVHIARTPGERPITAKELSRAVGVPRNYLGKVLHELVRAGVLRSTRGKLGGFRLALPPGELSLVQIVSLFDPIGERRRCLLGRPECSEVNPCPMHHRWKEVAEQISRFFSETTLADVLANGSLSPG